MLINADALHIPLADQSVHCVVTSPPYYRLRDYGVNGQIGLERTPEEYIASLVTVFREVWRVMRDDATLWLNMGDSYAGSGGAHTKDHANPGLSKSADRDGVAHYSPDGGRGPDKSGAGLKPKDLMMMPARVALALQADGWWLRSDIIWAKPNTMPESVTDRPTTAHEHIFLLAKAEHYFYDAYTVREDVTGNSHPRGYGVNPKSVLEQGRLRARDATIQPVAGWNTGPGRHDTIEGRYPQEPAHIRLHAKTPGANSRIYVDRDPAHCVVRKHKQNASFSAAISGLVAQRNARSVWIMATQAYSGAHFATFPEELVRRCVMAGTSARGCCPACGAPWVRIVERGSTAHDGTSETAYEPESTAGRLSLLRQAARERGEEYVSDLQAIGWRPSCTCGEQVPCDTCHGEGEVIENGIEMGCPDCVASGINIRAYDPIAATVLDPFSGSGTTVQVAIDLGRRGVGLDLSPAYLDLARERGPVVMI